MYPYSRSIYWFKCGRVDKWNSIQSSLLCSLNAPLNIRSISKSKHLLIYSRINNLYCTKPLHYIFKEDQIVKYNSPVLDTMSDTSASDITWQVVKTECIKYSKTAMLSIFFQDAITIGYVLTNNFLIFIWVHLHLSITHISLPMASERMHKCQIHPLVLLLLFAQSWLESLLRALPSPPATPNIKITVFSSLSIEQKSAGSILY